MANDVVYRNLPKTARKRVKDHARTKSWTMIPIQPDRIMVQANLGDNPPD
jgi:hypothetical protein